MFFNFYMRYDGNVNRKQFITGVLLGLGLLFIPLFLTLVSSFGRYMPEFLHECFMLIFPFKRELHMANIYEILERASRMKKDINLLAVVFIIRSVGFILGTLVLSSVFVRRIRYLTGGFSRVYLLMIPLVFFEPSLFLIFFFGLIVSDSEAKLKNSTKKFFEGYSDYVKAVILIVFLCFFFANKSFVQSFKTNGAPSALMERYQSSQKDDLLAMVKEANKDITLLKKDYKYVQMKYETISAYRLRDRDKRVEELLKENEQTKDLPSQIKKLNNEILMRDKFIRELDNEVRSLDVANKELKDELFLVKRRMELDKK